ncbi:hypothetical protein [Nocardioides sp. NPDC047086]|uniref:fibronectin type III domain-containing protein n=1 Tax=Nocardioides sp. NPDC047086 TaxID=3154810 RepID=UPI0033F326E1
MNNGDPQSSPEKDPTTGESSLPSDPDTLEPDEKPSEKESDEPEVVDDDIVPAANTGVTFIPAGNVPSGSTPTCELDPSACEDTRPPGAGVDICEIRPDLTQCQEPEPPTTPPGDGDPTTPPDDDCLLPLGLLCPEDPGPEDPGPEDPGPGDPEDDNTPPSKVSDVACRVNQNDPRIITVTWGDARDNVGVESYAVYTDQNFAQPSEKGPHRATYELRAGNVYNFWVRAVDAAENQSEEWDVVTCATDVEAPEIPSNLDVQSVEPTASTLELTWERSFDNPRPGGVGEVTYNVYRDGEFYLNVDGLSYEDTELESDREYKYQVQAVDGAGNKSERTEVVTGKTMMPPTAPTNVQIANAGPLGFDVSWTASTDPDGETPQDRIAYHVDVEGGGCISTTVTGSTSARITCVNLFGADSTVTVTAEDGGGNLSEPSAPASTANTPQEGDGAALRSTTPGEEKSDAPADSPVPSDVPDVKAPVEEPTEEKSPLLPGLDDILPGGDDAAEAPAEEPAEPEAEPSESESLAARPTTEEPADEATEDAPAEEDEGGLLGDIVDSVTSAVAAVF